MAPSRSTGGGLLEADGITVQFGGNTALSDVTLRAEPGQITGLIGPNGAGKTTTFNVLCGLQATVRGRVRLDGEEITTLAPHRRARLGVARTFQRLETFSLLTVRENVLAGAELRARRFRSGGNRDRTTEEILAKLGLVDVADQRVDSLPTGRARLVEIGRALAGGPRVLLLDEPSSGLNEIETAALAEVLAELRADGLTILLVEHDMSLVMGSCDQIYVLDFGQILTAGEPAQIQADPDVRRAYLGDDHTDDAVPAHATAQTHDGPSRSTALLKVDDLCAGYGDIDVISDVTFEVGVGEVFALLGPNGAGKSTTLKVIAGLVPASRGSVTMCGREVLGADADALARAGVCMVPEGRGIFPNLTVAENLWMASCTGVNRADIEARAYERFPKLSERRTQTAGTMSGGEQQMLAMARALATDPALLILDELSMGLAPIIVAELYEHVATIAAEGLSILVVEQFAHEVLGVADTAAVMLHGRIRTVGSPDQVAEELESAYLTGSIAK